jgi:hypothetical protein
MLKLDRRAALRLLSLSGAAALLPEPAKGARPSEINSDVCILGGGASGIYAAIRLMQLGYSVTVVEKTGRIGGHTQTYYDPITGNPIDIGVVVFLQTPLQENYFSALGVTDAPVQFAVSPTIDVDFRTGQPVDAYSPTEAEVAAAFLKYLELYNSRFSFLNENGYQIPPNAPAELFLPFGDFAALYSLKPLLPTFAGYCQGYGNLLATTAVYILKLVGPAIVEAILGLNGAAFVNIPGGNSLLYKQAAKVLGDAVLLNAGIQSVARTASQVQVTVQTPAGMQTVTSSRLVVSFPQVPSNFQGFDLDSLESSVFTQFSAYYYGTGVVQLSGLAETETLNNAAPNTPANVALPPEVYSFYPAGFSELFNVKYGALTDTPAKQVIGSIAGDIRRLNVPNLAVSLTGFPVFSSHYPFALHVSPASLEAGFYNNFQGLQGHNATYYTGAALQTHNSSLIWNQTEAMVQSLIAGL